jgi:hypothetical protein
MVILRAVVELNISTAHRCDVAAALGSDDTGRMNLGVDMLLQTHD